MGSHHKRRRDTQGGWRSTRELRGGRRWSTFSRRGVRARRGVEVIRCMVSCGGEVLSVWARSAPAPRGRSSVVIVGTTRCLSGVGESQGESTQSFLQQSRGWPESGRPRRGVFRGVSDDRTAQVGRAARGWLAVVWPLFPLAPPAGRLSSPRAGGCAPPPTVSPAATGSSCSGRRRARSGGRCYAARRSSRWPLSPRAAPASMAAVVQAALGAMPSPMRRLTAGT